VAAAEFAAGEAEAAREEVQVRVTPKLRERHTKIPKKIDT